MERREKGELRKALFTPERYYQKRCGPAGAAGEEKIAVWARVTFVFVFHL